MEGVTHQTGAADWRRNLVAVTVAVFVGFTGFTLVMPFLPLYFEQLGVASPGAVAVWSGLSLGVTPAITAALAPFWARVADRFGRKLLVARSIAAFVVIMAVLAAVTAAWHVLALRILLGLFAGYGAIALTMAAESAPREHVARAIGWVQTAQRLGPALGPVIGGALAQGLGLRETFLVASGFYLAAFALVVAGYRETRPAVAGGGPGRPPPVSLQALRAVPHFTLFIGTVFGLQLVDRSFGPVLPLYLREVGIAAPHVALLSGVIFTTAAGAAALGNQATGLLLRLAAPGRLVPAVTAAAALAAALFGAGPPAGVLVGAAIVFGFGIGVATTAIYTAASQSVDAERRGGAFGYLTTAYLLGLAISPVAAGLLGSLSMRAVFLADAAGLGVMAWLAHRAMGAPAAEGVA